jgi:hypothetical protein
MEGNGGKKYVSLSHVVAGDSVLLIRTTIFLLVFALVG